MITPKVNASLLDQAAIAGHILAFKENGFDSLIQYLIARGHLLPLQEEQFRQKAGTYIRQMIVILSVALDKITGEGENGNDKPNNN